jgi:hypothetical protein
MQRAAQKFLVRGWYRGVACVMLLVLVLTPSCSSVCQAWRCPISQPANSDFSCHHEQGANSEDSQRFTAAGASCGWHELPAALPEGKSSLEERVTPADSSYSPAFFTVVATYAGVLSDSLFPRDTGPTCTHRSAAGQFSFDTFVSLRI